MAYTSFAAHQGDVQIYGVDSIPSGARQVKKQYFARSERTGHIHALCGQYDLYEDPTVPNAFYVRVYGEGAVLNHVREQGFDHWDEAIALEVADHKPVFLPEGLYRVGIQRRFDPFARSSVFSWRHVTD